MSSDQHNTSCSCKDHLRECLEDTDCKDCVRIQQQTLRLDGESFLWEKLHCYNHISRFCASCQIYEANGFAFHGPKGNGLCADCAESNSRYTVSLKEKHLHHQFCDKPYNTCNYRKDLYCHYFQSVARYPTPSNKEIFDGLDLLCREAVKSRMPKR